MCTVLIVEDDFPTLELMADLLERKGYSTATAADGKEALDRIERGLRPSLILLDLMMPVMDGWEFLARKHANPRIAAIPTIVISASASQAPRYANHLLAKPIKVSMLFNLVARYCRLEDPPIA